WICAGPDRQDRGAQGHDRGLGGDGGDRLFLDDGRVLLGRGEPRGPVHGLEPVGGARAGGLPLAAGAQRRVLRPLGRGGAPRGDPGPPHLRGRHVDHPRQPSPRDPAHGRVLRGFPCGPRLRGRTARALAGRMTMKLPALFLSHGAPTLAVEETNETRAWAALAKELPSPREILAVSAHWDTATPEVSAAARPETIHDFNGFPRALYEQRYDAPGAPGLAEAAAKLLA